MAGNPAFDREGTTWSATDTGVSELCITCGLCCDGTIYARGDLRPEEVEDAERAGFTIIHERRGFYQPCPFLGGRACTIHDKPRPHTCGDFFCSLADEVRQGALAMSDAKAVVREAWQLKDTISALGHPGENITEAKKRWLEEIARGMPPRNPALSIALLALEKLVDRRFRRPNETTVGLADRPSPR